MTLKVQTQDFKDLSPAEQASASDNGCGKEYATYIRVSHGGETLFLESDACEPEDKNFLRDLRWVKDAIRKAYELGLEDGRKAPPAHDGDRTA